MFNIGDKVQLPSGLFARVVRLNSGFLGPGLVAVSVPWAGSSFFRICREEDLKKIPESFLSRLFRI